MFLCSYLHFSVFPLLESTQGGAGPVQTSSPIARLMSTDEKPTIGVPSKSLALTFSLKRVPESPTLIDDSPCGCGAVYARHL